MGFESACEPPTDETSSSGGASVAASGSRISVTGPTESASPAENASAAESSPGASPGLPNDPIGVRIKTGLSKSEFEAIYSQGKRVAAAYCRIMSLPGSGRFGFAAPKALGSQPRRNCVKRRLKEAVRQCVGASDLSRDYVILGKVEASAAEFRALCQDVAAAMLATRERWESESECS